MAELEVEVTETPEPTPPSDEEIASGKGWQDLDAWTEAGHDPKDHVDAKTFNIRGQFIGDLKRQEAEIAELRRKTEKVSELLTESNKKAYEKGLKEAEERHARAVEEGDTAGAKKALDDVKDLTTAVQSPTANPFDEWVSENDWFTQDPDLFEYADKMDRYLAAQKRGQIGDVKNHMNEVRKLVEQKYPEKFGNPARAETPVTDAPSQRTRQSPKSKYSYKDLNETQRSFCDEFVEMGVMTRDEYVKSLIDSGELS